MLTRTRRVLATLALPLLATATLVALPAAPAQAAPNGPCGECETTVTPGSEEGRFTARIEVRGLTAGGSVVRVPHASVTIRPDCYYERGLSGADYFEWFDSGEVDQLRRLFPGWPSKLFERPPDLEEHKDEDGYWWHPTCDGYRWLDEFRTPAQRSYLQSRSSVFVEAGGAPPAAVVVDPELLAEEAYEAVDIPLGDIRYNPTRDGDEATFVNLDTWVWLEGAPVELEITATLGTVWVRIDAALDGIDVDGDGADLVTCDGPGKPWSAGAGAAGACRLVFERSSAGNGGANGVPTSTMDVAAHWTARWVSSEDAAGGDLDPQTIEDSTEVPVAEIQSVVTDDD